MLSFDFFIAGRAIFTVANETTKKHYTYKIVKKTFEETKEVKFFLNVLTGPDNTSNYTYVGEFVPAAQDRQTNVRLTRKSPYRADNQIVRVAAWALFLAKTQTEPPPGYLIQHAGRCGKCGKPLTEPESLKSGFGPTCRSHLGIEAKVAEIDEAINIVTKGFNS